MLFDYELFEGWDCFVYFWIFRKWWNFWCIMGSFINICRKIELNVNNNNVIIF